jgi:antibiotic biosynthesis monooxygenase (ABM) superfamily enzyme
MIYPDIKQYAVTMSRHNGSKTTHSHKFKTTLLLCAVLYPVCLDKDPVIWWYDSSNFTVIMLTIMAY